LVRRLLGPVIFPYPTLFRSAGGGAAAGVEEHCLVLIVALRDARRETQWAVRCARHVGEPTPATGLPLQRRHRRAAGGRRERHRQTGRASCRERGGGAAGGGD